MPPKQADSDSKTILGITLTSESATSASFQPQMQLVFPGQQPKIISLTSTPSRPQSKKPQKRSESVEAPQTFVIEEKIQCEHEIIGPDALIAAFTSDQLKISLEDANSKQKQSTQPLMFDVSGLLVCLEFRNQVALQLNDFKYKAELKIVVTQSVHPQCRVTRFLSPQTLPVFVFKVLSAEKLFQFPDSEWRQRYLQPVRVECTLLGNTYTSEKIQQTLLGDGKYSDQFAIRINCSYACKTQQDALLLSQQLEEKYVCVKVYCRERADLQAQDGAKTAPKSAQKGKAKPEVRDSVGSIRFYAFCQFSLRQLLAERIVDQYFSLQPYYEYPEKISVISQKAQFLASAQRRPQFLPPVQQFDAKGKPLAAQPGTQTQFDTYQLEPEMTPLGDWSKALIHIVAAVQQPLQDFGIESLARSESAKSIKSSKSQRSSVRQDDICAEVKKPQFNHFERMYIYMNPKQNEILKQVLTYIGAHNVKFIFGHATAQYKQQFGADAAENLDSYVGILSTTGIRAALKDSDVQSTDLSYISGYRFVDRHIQLLYLEAPAKFDVFADLRAILDKTHTTYKAAPAAVFRKRILGESPFLLRHFALYKSLLRLSMQNMQESAIPTAFMKLFNVTENKLFPLEPIKFDLRAYQQANLFFDSAFIDEMLKHFAGNIPKNNDLNTLFYVGDAKEQLSPHKFAGSPSLYSFPKDTMSAGGDSPRQYSSRSPKSRNTSPTRSVTQSPSRSPKQSTQKREDKAIEIICFAHPPPTEYPQLLPIPSAIIAGESHIQNRASSKQLPQFEIKQIDNLLGTSAELHKQSARGNEVLETLATEIAQSSQLKGTSVIKDVLEGKRVFLYSTQRLNKFEVQNQLIGKVCAGKPLDVDIEMGPLRKRGELYDRERAWK